MTTPLPQPPDEAPLSSRKHLSWILQGIAGCVVVMALAGLSKPVIVRSPKGADRMEAVNNAKEIGAMLIGFDTGYGRFPDVSTIAAVKARTATPLSLGSTSSNDLFRQLLAGSGAASEKPFWAKTAISPHKADDRFGSDANTLVKGECGLAYVAGLSLRGTPHEAPVVMTSLLPGKLLFDREAFPGKAVILHLDLTIAVLPVEEDGRVLVNGMDLFDPRQPYWAGKKPDVKWPE